MNAHDEHDAWLAQALRHAPDANADAPRAVSDTILREARAAALRPAVAAVPPRPDNIGPMQWLASCGDWLARPPVAAGFASVVVATLVGVMRWGQPLDQSLPREPEVVASTPQARAEPAPAAAIAPAPGEPSVEPRQPGGAVPAPAQQSTLKAIKEAAKKPGAETTARARAEATTAPTAPATPAAAAAPTAAHAALPAAPRAPTPQAAAGETEALASPAPRPELATPAAKAAADKAAPLGGDPRATQGSAGPSLAKERTADAGNVVLTELLASVTRQPERWRWQRGSGEPQKLTAGLQRWLTRFDRSTASRWRTAAPSAARESASDLRLSRDGVLQATLGFANSGVWFETGGAFAPTLSVALLPEGSADTLRRALDQTTP